tara:strand:- start:2152 stop:3162 length:1011 start_codon:yes stop_codon:yes gene_type:complete
MANLKENKILEAINLFNSGNLHESNILIEEILKKEPNNINAINLKGGIYLKNSNFNKALEIFKSGFNVDPNNITILRNIITTLNNLKNYTESQKYIEKINTLAKNSPETVIQLANNFILQGKKEKALELIDKNISRNPESDKLVLAKANCFFELGEFSKSKELYSKSFARNPNNFHTLFRLGYLNLEDKEFNNAINYFEKILISKETYQILNNEIALTLYNLGLCYEAIENYIKAEQNYLESIKYNTLFMDAYVNLSNVYTNMNKIKEALNYMRKAINIDPKKRILYVNISTIYDKAGQHREAVFCKRIGAGSIVFKSKKEYGSFTIDKVELNETT